MPYDGEARGRLKVVEQELNDEGLERAAEDEMCDRTCGEGEENEGIVIGSDIEAEVAAKGSSEECEDSRDSEEKVHLDGSTEESKMRVFSKDSDNSETTLRWGDFLDVASTCKALLMMNVVTACLMEKPLDGKRATGHESVLK